MNRQPVAEPGCDHGTPHAGTDLGTEEFSGDERVSWDAALDIDDRQFAADEIVVSQRSVRAGIRQQFLFEEDAESIQRFCRCRQLSDTARESVRHSHPDIKPHIRPGSNSALDISARIVEQYFVVSDMDTHRRLAGKPAESGEASGSFGSALPKYERTSSVTCGSVKDGSASARVTYDSPESVKSVTGDNAATPTSAVLPETASPGMCAASISARLPPAESPVTGNPANIPCRKPAVTRQHILHGRRKRMLGSKPVVRDECARSRSRGDVPDKVTIMPSQFQG